MTNLLMRVGDFAHAGASNISVIDTDSFWIDGYFEETKLAGICVGDRTEVKLIGYSQPIIGHVATVTRGVSVSNSAGGSQGLPNVDPVYTWVRLAQRVPVRIAIDQVPRGATGFRNDCHRNGSTSGRWASKLARSHAGQCRGSSCRTFCKPAAAPKLLARYDYAIGPVGVHPR